MILKAEKLQHNVRIREDLRKALLEGKKNSLLFGTINAVLTPSLNMLWNSIVSRWGNGNVTAARLLYDTPWLLALYLHI